MVRLLLALSLLAAVGCRGRSKPRTQGDGPSPATAPAGAERRQSAEPACLEWVRVEVPLPGEAPAEVDRLVVVPIEAAIAGLSTVRTIAARATEGRATVWAGMPPNDDAANSIRSAIAPGSLPPEADPPVVTRETPTTVVVLVFASDRDPPAARAAAEDLSHRLERLPKVVAATLLGDSAAVLAIHLDLTRLRAFGLGPSDVEAALAAVREPIGADELARLLVGSAPGDAPIHLADVASIREERADPAMAARLDGHPATAVAIWTGDADPVTEAIRDARVPPGVAITVLGTIAPVGCAHPLYGRSIDGDLALLQLSTPSGSAPTPGLVRQSPGGLWLLEQVDLLAGPRGAPVAAQWLATATRPDPDVAAMPGIAIDARARPGLRTLAVALAGNDHGALDAAAGQLASALAAGPGRILALPAPRPELHIELDASAPALGVRPGDLRAYLSPGGVLTGAVTSDGRAIQLVVGKGLDDPAQLSEIELPTRDGAWVPLTAVARVTRELTADVTRLDRQPVRIVQIATDDVAGSRTAIGRALADLPLPPGVTAHAIREPTVD